MAEARWRALVVDDEPNARDAVTTLLAGETRVEIVGTAANGRDAVARVRELRPDLLFLDVQMPDLDGFQVLEALGDDVPRGVVFVTAHDEHALRAFEVHALDYLLKPFGKARFRTAVTRALERLAAQDALTRQGAAAAVRTAVPPRREDAGVVTAADAPASRPLRIGVRHGARTILVELEAIDWIEACGDYLRLHGGGGAHLVTETMGKLETLLDPAVFLRIHRSAIVNLRKVLELHRDPDGSGSVLLKGGVRLRVARGRWDALESALSLIRL